MNNVITDNMTPIMQLHSAPIEYHDEVIYLAERAISYLGSMTWCSEIINGWLSCSWGYILCVFYFEFLPAQKGVPNFVWILVGDLPYAYIDVNYCPTPTDAINGYIHELQRWIDKVSKGELIDDSIIPVNVPPDKVWADRLQSRLNMLRSHILQTEVDDDC